MDYTWLTIIPGLSFPLTSLCQGLFCILWAQSCLCHFYFIPCTSLSWQTSSYGPAFVETLQTVATYKFNTKEKKTKTKNHQNLACN